MSDCTSSTDGTNSLDCVFKVPNNIEEISLVMVSGGGGGAGATNPTVNTNQKLTAANSSIGNSQTKELTITSSMKNIVVSNLIGSGAGGGGASWGSSGGSGGGGGPQSQADCDPYNALFIPAAYNGSGGKNLCVTKYNVGDPNGPDIASSTIIAPAGHRDIVGTFCFDSDKSCCWKGNTSTSCTSSGSWSGGYSNYSGCTRTLCTWYAAKDSCKTWAPSGTKAGDWRLPTEAEIMGWKNNMTRVNNYMGSNGLQLCDWKSSSDGSVKCDHINNGCYEGEDMDCFPSNFWSSVGNVYYHFYGKIGGPDWEGNYRYAASARCVLGGSQTLAALSGGGGGAGAYIKNYQIPNDVISSNIGGKIKLFSAAGGSGGNSASSQGSSASNGSNGNTSYIEIYDKDNVLKWGIRALGGNYGYRATSTAAGNGGAQTSANSCQLYENGVWRSINCTGVGIKGTNGNKVESASSTNTATGGSGGGSMYNSSTVIGGGSGGSISSANGYNGSVYGAGGGGATIVFDSSNNVTKGIGGNGANGVAEITYDLVRQAAGGGGGGRWRWRRRWSFYQS